MREVHQWGGPKLGSSQDKVNALTFIFPNLPSPSLFPHPEKEPIMRQVHTGIRQSSPGPVRVWKTMENLVGLGWELSRVMVRRRIRQSEAELDRSSISVGN